MPSDVGRNLLTCGVYANPIYLERYILGAFVRPFHTDANYRVKTIAPDPPNTIMTTKRARRVGITFMGPFVYQRLSPRKQERAALSGITKDPLCNDNQRGSEVG